MKMLILLCVGLLTVVTPYQAAGQNALEEEMEDYARDFYREHPDAAGEKNRREAREELVSKVKSHRVLELNKEQEKMLRRRKQLVADDAYKTALDQLKALNRKDAEISFLIQYAEQKRMKPVERLLAHRLSQHMYQQTMSQIAEARAKRMHAVMAKYTAYQSEHSKAPASLSDLQLPEDCRQFVDPATGEKSDWIYIGHLGARLKAGQSYIVLAEPVPLGDSRACGLNNGKIARFKDSSIKGHLEKLAKASSGGGKGRGSVKTGTSNHPGIPALKSLMKKYRVYKQLHSNTAPRSLSDLDLTADEKQYVDPASGEKSDWIFLGEKSRIRTRNGTAVVLVAPKPYKGKRIVGLADGRHSAVADNAISKHLP